jgi:hypothetical protein
MIEMTYKIKTSFTENAKLVFHVKRHAASCANSHVKWHGVRARLALL